MTPRRIFLDTNVFIIGVALPDSPEENLLVLRPLGSADDKIAGISSRCNMSSRPTLT